MPALTRAVAVPETSQSLCVPVTVPRHDDGTVISGAAAAGKFGLTLGGFGAGGAMLEGEAASGNTKTSTLHFRWAVPQNFDTAAATRALALAINCRVSVVANTAATIDAEVYKSNGQGGQTGGDLVTTAATNINSATWAEVSFTVNPGSLTPGDELDVFVRAVVNDSGAANSAKAQIGGLRMVATTRM